MTVEARPPVFILFISLRSLSSSKRKRLESSCFSCLELETNPRSELERAGCDRFPIP